MREQDIITLIENDPGRMSLLCAVRTLGLPGWCIGAEFVRNAIWGENKDES